MITILCIALVIAVATILIIAYAINSACDGYEDENGFHKVRTADSETRHRNGNQGSEQEAELPSMLPSP